MRGTRALEAEVLSGFDEAFSEVTLPDAVHKSSRSEWRLGIDKPLREGETRGGVTFWERMEKFGNVRFDDVLRLALLATIKETGDAWLRDLTRDERGSGLGMFSPNLFDTISEGDEVGL